MCLFTIQHVVYTYQNKKVVNFMLPWQKGIKPSMNIPKIGFKANSLMTDKQMCRRIYRPTLFFRYLVTEPNPTLNITFYVQ